MDEPQAMDGAAAQIFQSKDQMTIASMTGFAQSPGCHRRISLGLGA